jgi:hypothetical protein
MARGSEVIALAAIVALASCGCVAADVRYIQGRIDRARDAVRGLACQDGAPVRVLVDPACAGGICGVSCAPDRWKGKPPC